MTLLEVRGLAKRFGGQAALAGRVPSPSRRARSTPSPARTGLEARSLRGRIKIMGFDATKEAVQATVDGRLAGSVAQNPRMMGQRGVEAALAALEGKPVEKRIDTGTELVTAANAAKYLK